MLLVTGTFLYSQSTGWWHLRMFFRIEDIFAFANSGCLADCECFEANAGSLNVWSVTFVIRIFVMFAKNTASTS